MPEGESPKQKWERRLKFILYGFLALFTAFCIGRIDGTESAEYRAFMEMDALK